MCESETTIDPRDRQAVRKTLCDDSYSYAEAIVPTKSVVPPIRQGVRQKRAGYLSSAHTPGKEYKRQVDLAKKNCTDGGSNNLLDPNGEFMEECARQGCTQNESAT